jgi:hypothetical protein
MACSDPIKFAAEAANMTDSELYDVFVTILADEKPNDYQQAVLDEAERRGMLTGSEADAISRSDPST